MASAEEKSSKDVLTVYGRDFRRLPSYRDIDYRRGAYPLSRYALCISFYFKKKTELHCVAMLLYHPQIRN
jgi:hypothetical protein